MQSINISLLKNAYMETKQAVFDLVKQVSKGDYEAFQILSMLANSKNSSKALFEISSLGIGPNEIKSAFKDIADSNIEKFSSLLSVIPYFEAGTSKDAIEISKNADKSISIKSFFTILGFSMADYIYNYPRTPTQSMEWVLSSLKDANVRGEEIFKMQYESAIAKVSMMEMLRRKADEQNDQSEMAQFLRNMPHIRIPKSEKEMFATLTDEVVTAFKERFESRNNIEGYG